MASDHREIISRATHMQNSIDDYDSENDSVQYEDEEEEEEEEVKGKSKCKTRIFMCGRGGCSGRRGWSLGQVLDPKARWIQEWNRVFLLVCATGLFVDPLFFYALSISDTCMCLFIDGWFAITVTALRCMTDALHVWNMWLQFKMAKKPSHIGVGSGGAQGGTRFTSPSSVALRYLKARKGFFFDLFVILPFPQVRII